MSFNTIILNCLSFMNATIFLLNIVSFSIVEKCSLLVDCDKTNWILCNRDYHFLFYVLKCVSYFIEFSFTFIFKSNCLFWLMCIYFFSLFFQSEEYAKVILCMMPAYNNQVIFLNNTGSFQPLFHSKVCINVLHYLFYNYKILCCDRMNRLGLHFNMLFSPNICKHKQYFSV